MKPQAILLLILFFSMAACKTDAELEFHRWDQNNDGIISKAEFEGTKPYLNFYDEWDLDASSLVSEEEWQKGVNRFYSELDEGDYGTFSDWDKNNEGSLNEEDFGKRIFELWDADNSNSLDLEEFETWYPEYLG